MEVELDNLLAKVKEIEELLRFPSVAGHVEKANALAISIARQAPPHGGIANQAMKLMSAVNTLRQPAQSRSADTAGFTKELRQLQLALQEAKQGAREAEPPNS